MPEEEERQKLAALVQQWNNNRLDLFEISQPDKNLEFHGVVRFYFEDHAAGNVATKCLRVGSKSSTREVIDTLSEKFRPDMKMLTTSYSLYEVHTDEERKLDLNEKPLVVQLNWNSDTREGRFVLKSDVTQENCHDRKEKGGVIQNFRRTLSRKEKNKGKNKTKHRDEDGSTQKATNNDDDMRGSDSKREKTKQMPTENIKQERTQSDPGSLRTNYLEQPGLPMGIKFSHNSEDAFLSAVINYTNSSTVHFRLSPAYALYAAGRFVLQRHRGQGSRHSEQTRRTTSVINKMVGMTEMVLQKQQAIAGALAFWMANTSELLNFIKQDKDLCPLTQKAQEDLSHLVHRAFKYLLQCLQNELKKHMPTFLIDPEQHGPLPAGIEMVLNTLMNTMSLLRRCRVNPALTIQLFSQLFHFISAWLFNQLMGPEASTLGLRCHYWGAAIRQRLSGIEAWAERQGLELAADCHLGHIIQATMLLTMNKYSMQDAKDIQNTCFKLNSLQLQTLLTTYLYAADEPRIPPGLIDIIVAAAEISADNPVQSEGCSSIQLGESLDLRLPFLLPEGGYSCDTVRGIPPGLREFMEPICCKGLCTLTSQPNIKGSWTVFFSETTPSTGNTDLGPCREPEIVTITLKKPLNSGMGVSIVAAKGAGEGKLGIYVKSIVHGGPAEMDGRLTAGDQLLSVDGKGLVGLNQERAAGIMMQTGPFVTLQVAKLGACYHGLEALLSEAPSETNTGDNGPGNNGPGGAKPNGKALILYNRTAHSPSEQWENHHGAGRRRKEQMLMRNRQLYRSNPNMTDPVYEDGEQLVDAVPAVSAINLCTDTYQREYLTLPAPRSQDKKKSSEYDQQRPMFKVSLSLLGGQSTNKRTFMRQALSQENLCMDSGGPLLDKQSHVWEQEDQRAKHRMSNYSSFPMRPCISTNDILSDYSSSTKQQQDGRKGGAGFWRAPVSLNPTPTPSVQPIRIDIPVTRAGNTQSNPPLTTFRQNAALLPVKLNQNLRGNGRTPQDIQKPPSQLQAHHIYACPTPAAKRLPQPSLPQRRPITCKDQEPKPQTTTTATKHVSFQKLPSEQQPGVGTRQKDPQYFTMTQERGSDSSGLSPDPWRREAKEKLEKQQRLQAVDLLEQEVKELQAKASRTPEESDRLCKLSLEWQFQKRLQEYRQNGDEEEEDEDMAMMMTTIQQLDTRAQRQDKGHSRAQQNSEIKDLDEQATTHLQEEDEMKITSDHRSSAFEEDAHEMASKENQGEKFKRGQAPENLTFKERQRLFSLVSSASMKVKAL